MSERVERVLGREREGAAAWAGREVGAAALGDARVGGAAGATGDASGGPAPQPSASLPQARSDPPGALKAAYRFFANPAVA